MPTNLDFPLYLNISLYSILALGAFFGFLRGFKKSLYSFITTFIFYVVFFLTVNLAVSYLWTLSLPQLSQLFALISPELASATSFSEVAPLALGYFAGPEYASVTTNANFLELATGLGIFALKLVYTIIYFTIIFIIYKLLCLIIRAIIFGGNKKNDKYVSKNRGLGLLFGVLEGAIALYVSLIIFGGVMSISESLVNLAPVEETQQVVLEFPREHLYEASYTVLADSVIPTIPPEITGMIEQLKIFTDAYNSNLLVSLSNQLTMTDENAVETPLNLYLFDEVLSFEYNENQVSIRKELSTFATIGAYVLDMEYVETNEITDITGDNIRDIFELLSHSDLIVSILPLGIEIGSIYLETPLTVPTEDLYAIDWQDELTQLGGIAATAFDIVSQIGVLEGEVNYEEIDVDGDTMRDLFGALGESQLITLAAYVAIEPLLENVGGTVQAVMTLPAGVNWEDIDWQDEFTGLGAILGAVLDTGITYQQATSGDYQLILSAVAEIDFTVLLQSKIVCYSLVNVLSGAAGIAGLEMIVVPDGIEWLIYDEDGVTIIGGELQYILEALSAMTSVIGELDFENLSPAVLSDLSDESIDTIFESRVLVASLSSVLLGIDLGDFELIVPYNAVDEDFYILKDEMKSMLKAVKLIMELPECDEETEDCTNLEPDYLANALSLSDTEIDTLLASNILKATVGNLITDMNQDPLVIPDTVLEGVQIAFPEVRREETINIVSGDEIKKVIQAVMVFEITDFENMAIDASIIAKLEGAETPGVIDEDKLTKIFASGVIHATISDIILDLMTTDDPFITVPYFEEDGVTEVRYTVGTLNYISVDELKAVLRALHSVNITDFENVEASLDINAILANVDLLLESAVLQATISKQLLDMSDTIVVPETYFGDVAIQIEVGEVAELTNTTYILSDELENIFDALSVLNIDDINSIQMDASIINNLEDTNDEDLDLITTEISQNKLDTLFGSAIIHATLSDVLLELMSGDSAYVVVPHYGLDELNVEFEILQTYNTIDYIAVSELSSALKALYALNITDFNTIETAITLDVILNNIDELLDSSILHATVSKQLLDMNNGSVIIPVTSLNDDPIQIETGDVLLQTNTTYITRDELRGIFDALDILGISDINTVTFDATIINNLADTLDEDLDLNTDELSDAKLTTLFSSSIIHATISDMLFDLENGENAYVTVPSFGLTDLNVEFAIEQSAYGINYVIQSELENVLKALYALDITDFNTMEDSLTLDVLIANIDILLDSSILHATVSKTLLDMNGDAISIPYVNWDEEPIVIQTGDVLLLTNTDYITRDELVSAFDALDILGITDVDTFTGTVDLSVLSVEGNMEILLASSIIQATVTTQLVEQATLGNLVVPYVREDNITVIRKTVGPVGYETEYIISEELESIFNALDILGISDVETFTGTVDLSVIAEGDNSSIILSSSVIQATVTDQIVTLETEDKITLPKYMEDNTTEIVQTVGAVGFETDYIPKSELEALFDALDILGLTDVNNFTGTVDLSVLAEGTNAHTVLLSSIVQATVSEQVLSLDTDGTISVPYVDQTETIAVRILTGSGLDAFEYVKASELEAMILALDILGITDVELFTGTVDLTNFFEEAGRNTLLASSTMHATISKQILDLGPSVLTVPYLAEDDVTEIRKTVGVIGYQTEYIASNEIHAMFEALEILNITDINSFSGTISLDNFFEQPGQDKVANRTTLLASASMHATITKQLVDLDTAGTLIVPTLDQLGFDIRVLTGPLGFETEFVVKTEILAMFDALETLGINDINAFTGTVDLNNVYGDTNQNMILASAMMHATITKQINDLGPTILVVPATDVDGNAISSTVSGTFFLNKAEIKGLINALELLGIADITTFTGSVSLSTLFASMTPEYDDNQEILLSSASMHATITKQINDLGPTVLVVPDTDVTADLIKDDDFGTLFIYKDEIKALINALDILGIADITSFTGTVSLNAFLPSTSPLTYNANQNILLASASMHATITKQINDLGSSILLVPMTDVNTQTVKETVVGTLYIYKDEIKSLINALDLLGVTDITAFTGSVSLNSIFGSETNQNTLLASASMHATISKQITDLGPTVLVVPTTDVSNQTVRGTVSLTDFVYKNEIKALINALDILGVNDITGFSGTVSLTSFFESTTPLEYDANQDILLASASMHATITNQINDLGSSTLLVPQTDIDNNIIQDTISGNFYIYKSEIKSLINALDILGVSDITNFSGGFSLTSLALESDQTTLLTSASMHATISQTLLDLNDDVLIVPNYTEAGEVEINRIRKTVGLTDFIVKPEIKALINSFTAMGFTDLDSFGTEISSSAFFTNPDLILLSSSIQATFSSKMLNDTAGELVVPDTNVVTFDAVRIVLTDITYIELNEMKAIIHALDLLGLTNFATMDFTPASIFNADFDELLLSVSMQATISKNILSGALDQTAPAGSGSLIVPDYFREAILVATISDEQIEKVELKALLTALETLGISDFGGSMNASTVTTMTDGNLTTMLLSGSMYVTMDNMLKGNPNIVVPNKAYVGGNLTTPLYDINGLIQANEIKYFILAASTIPGADFTNVNFSYSAIEGLTPAEQTTVLTSMIVRNMVTLDLVTAVNTYNDLPVMFGGPDPVLYDPIPDSFYEDNDNTTFLTSAAILTLIDYLPA